MNLHRILKVHEREWTDVGSAHSNAYSACEWKELYRINVSKVVSKLGNSKLCFFSPFTIFIARTPPTRSPVYCRHSCRVWCRRAGKRWPHQNQTLSVTWNGICRSRKYSKLVYCESTEGQWKKKWDDICIRIAHSSNRSSYGSTWFVLRWFDAENHLSFPRNWQHSSSSYWTCGLCTYAK